MGRVSPNALYFLNLGITIIGTTNVDLKRCLLWGIASLFGIGIWLWQSDFFEHGSTLGFATPQQEQSPLNLSDIDNVKHIHDKAPAKMWLNSNALLQRALGGSHRPRIVQGGPLGIGSSAGYVSPEAMATYEAEKSSTEQAGLAYLLEQLDLSEGTARLEVITALWRFAAMTGMPEQAMTALDLATRNTDAVVADVATRAVADLWRFKRRMEEGLAPDELLPQPPALPSDMAGADKIGMDQSTAINDANYQARLADYQATMQQRETDAVQTLMGNLRAAKDDTEFNTVLHQLSLHRGVASVNAWLELVNDVNADARYAAVRSLWRSAASLRDDNGSIGAALATLSMDDKEYVADLAMQALSDLENFRLRQKQTASAPPPVATQGIPSGWVAEPGAEGQ